MSAVRDEHGRFARDGNAALSKILDRLGRDRCVIQMTNDGKTADIRYTTPAGSRGVYALKLTRERPS